MSPKISRRDFLKLSGLAPLSLAAPRLMSALEAHASTDAKRQNVIVLVFDAWSAYNISLYGYGRDTTPNLRRLAKRAIVYDNHFAASNFTTPGTASLLTGTLPWTHRAIQGGGKVARPFVNRNVFAAFQDYYRISYTHNAWASILLRQASGALNELVPPQALMLRTYDSWIHDAFPNDADAAMMSWMRYVDWSPGDPAYSLFYSIPHRALWAAEEAGLQHGFPRGIPTTGELSSDFLLETATDWIAARVSRIPRPFLGYFHLMPPHQPYRTTVEFTDRFKGDGYVPGRKPEDVFTEGASEDALLAARTDYDEYILYVDKEFGRLYDALDRSGLLATTWLVVTSDHGELHERGLDGHLNPTLYQPVTRVPLLLFEPGRTVGMHVHDPTSAVDLLPTLAQVTGHSIPNWCEGRVMPPFSTAPSDPNRSLYAVQARESQPYAPLTTATIAMVKGRYKLIYCFGYPKLVHGDLVKLYDLVQDPEELADLSGSKPGIAGEMLVELKSRLKQADQPYGG